MPATNEAHLRIASLRQLKRPIFILNKHLAILLLVARSYWSSQIPSINTVDFL